MSLRIVALASLLLAACSDSWTAEPSLARIEKQGNRWVLSNANLQRVVETTPFVRTVRLANRLTAVTREYPVESRSFVLALDDAALKLTGSDFQAGAIRVEPREDGASLIIPLACEKHGVKVAVTYWLGHKSFYLRKHLVIDPGDHLLNWVDVESFRLEAGPVHRFDQEPMPFRGQPWDIPVGRPLFVGSDLFLGVEHPAAVNACDAQRWIGLRQHPGRRGRVETSPAVIGFSPDQPRQRLLDSFETYVDENRARPVKRSIQWVAYFPAGMDDETCRQKIAIARRVFRERGAPLDVVLMDSGWTDPQSIMAVSRQRPDRLALMAKLVRQQLGAELGLHVITSGVKTMVDKDWLAAEGYDMIYHRNRREGAYCFADPRVMEVFRDNLVRYVAEHGIASYKFDWGHFACAREGHRGHLPGQEYGFEAGANNFIRVHQALRKANPQIFLFNTGWYSPWWLWTYDAVFASGADYNFGLVGPPSFSTAALLCSWRDATIRGNLVRWSPFFPLNSLMTVDPISYWWHDWEVRAESPLRPFTDYFITAALRGTQMTEIYNNIAAWSDAHADAAAAVLKWLRASDDVILASTRYLGGDPLKAEPYGYAHFRRDNRGLIVVRNPTIEPRSIAVCLNENSGFWPTEKHYVVRVVYPFHEVLRDTLRCGGSFTQALAGDEVRVLEVWPLDALPEPMPIGCRYQATGGGSTKSEFVIVQPPSSRLEFFSPVAIAGAHSVAGQPKRYILELPPRDLKAAKSTTTRPEVKMTAGDGAYQIKASVPDGTAGRLSLLLSPGGTVGDWTCDGRPIAAEAPHLALADAGRRQRGTKAALGKTSLFGVDLAAGQHELRFIPAPGAQNAKRGSLPEAHLVLDVSSDLAERRAITISHAAMLRPSSPRLPQNWAWQTRQIDTAQTSP